MLQNITMSKGGAYSLATRGAADVINASIPMIEQALSGMELRGRTDFRWPIWVVPMEEHPFK